MQATDTTAQVRQGRRYPERRGVSRRLVIEEAKAKVATIDLADRLCGPGKMRRVGRQWAALCPLPDHQERTPSFTVDPAKDVWFCHGCLRGGDVIELARFAWGYEKREAAMAAAELLHSFGHPIPEKPRSWYARQERQKPIRSKIDEIRTEVLMRRLFRWIFEPMIAEIEDDEERARMGEYVWEKVLPIAAWMVAERREST